MGLMPVLSVGQQSLTNMLFGLRLILKPSYCPGESFVHRLQIRLPGITTVRTRASHWLLVEVSFWDNSNRNIDFPSAS